MPYDFAIDTKTGDWLFSANRDIQGVEGDQVIQNRIINRLRIERGTWPLDPTDGALGSRLRSLTRVSRARALKEARLYVEEALAPMSDDISVTDVVVEEQGVSAIKLTISYDIIRSEDFVPATDRLSETLAVELPV